MEISLPTPRGPPLWQLHGVVYKGIPMYQIVLNLLSSLLTIGFHCCPYTLVTLPVGWSKSLSPDRTGRLGFGDDLFVNFIYNLIWILLLIIYFLIMTSTCFRNFLQLVIIVGIFLSSFFCFYIIYLVTYHTDYMNDISLLWEI